MNKESIGEKNSFINDRRSEILDKANFDKDVDNYKKENIKINLIDTQALDDIVKMINVREFSEEEKRTEIVDKFNKKRGENVLLNEEKNNENLEVNVENVEVLDRSEIVGKFKIDKESIIHSDEKKQIRQNIKKSDINLEQTIALDGVVDEISTKKFSEKEKRTEIVDKFSDRSINSAEDLEDTLEKLEDKEQENVENISIAMIIMIVVICAIVGTIIGYMLYKIAMNNSNVLTIIFNNLV